MRHPRSEKIPMLRTLISFLFIIGICNAPIHSSTSHKQPKPKKLLFGVVPQQSASKLAKKWVPIFKHLNRQLKLNIQFITAKDIPSFEKFLDQGYYDLAYMNPYHYTVVRETAGYEALVKAKDKKIKGIIVVRKDSPYQVLEDLRQQTLAFPAPAAFAASILTQAQFSSANIHIEARYVSSHDSVYRTVAQGILPAGGGVMRTFNNLDPKIKDQLKVLWTTQGYTPHAIATHPRVPNSTSLKLIQALSQLHESPEGLKLLQGINLKGFVEAKNEDWDDVRSLNIKTLNHLKTGP